MKNIFVGNLDAGATEADVRSLFEPYGNVKRVSIIKDRDTGQSKGFGFVEMRMDEDGRRAITQLNGKETAGKMLDVHPARPRIHQAK